MKPKEKIKQEIITVSVVSGGSGFRSKVKVKKYHIHKAKDGKVHAKLNDQFEFWNRDEVGRNVVRKDKLDMEVDKVFEK